MKTNLLNSKKMSQTCKCTIWFVLGKEKTFTRHSNFLSKLFREYVCFLNNQFYSKTLQLKLINKCFVEFFSIGNGCGNRVLKAVKNTHNLKDLSQGLLTESWQLINT
jgi:hypothetical protein